MKDTVVTETFIQRPHLVILGAGASLATLPNGDKQEKKLPLMNNFIKTLGLDDLFEEKGLNFNDNFEEIYSELYLSGSYREVLSKLENRVHEYFSRLEITDSPTVYDFLILSLREKDGIASFNWDPLLLQAYQRCRKITSKLPQLMFLHGNVLLGTCEGCNSVGLVSSNCRGCRKSFISTKLLYPIKQKNYEDDFFIKDQWKKVRWYWKNSFTVTIFGYGAPASDEGAIKLFKDAWGEVCDRNLEQIEIIDTRDEDELHKSWKEFIHTHHYTVHQSFFDSIIGNFPRRSNEAFWAMHMDVRWLDDHKITEDMSWEKLELHIQNLLKHEK